MKTGDKVVCVNDSPCTVCGIPVPLFMNSVYVSIGASDNWADGIMRLKILGYDSKCEHALGCRGWVGAWRFRRLDELKKEAASKIRQPA